MSENDLKQKNEASSGPVDDSGKSSSSGSSSSDEEEYKEDIGLALGREKREIKPNLMDDHIYFVKKRPVN